MKILTLWPPPVEIFYVKATSIPNVINNQLVLNVITFHPH
jgi:hypothetical protein